MLAKETRGRSSAKASVKESERTCVACRRERAPHALLRIVRAPDGELIADWKRNLPGRGAHVCVDRQCLAKAFERRLFGRALRGDVVYPSLEAFIAVGCETLRRHLATLLRSGVGSRTLCLGHDEALAAVRERRARGVLVATDSSSKNRFSELSESGDIPIRVAFTKDAFGEMLGRKPTGILVFTDKGLAASTLRVVDQFSALACGDSKLDEALFGEDGAESPEQLVR